MPVEVKITGTIKVDRRSAEETVNAEIADFSKFAAENLGEPLARAEAAIVKTYIGWKLGFHETNVLGNTGLDREKEQGNG